MKCAKKAGGIMATLVKSAVKKMKKPYTPNKMKQTYIVKK